MIEYRPIYGLVPTAAVVSQGTSIDHLESVIALHDVLGRVVTIRRTERDPGAGSSPHRHPGSHTFGYVLDGTYEVKIDDGPVRKLGPGETFYEPPGALHAVSRNGSSTQWSNISSFRFRIQRSLKQWPRSSAHR